MHARVCRLAPLETHRYPTHETSWEGSLSRCRAQQEGGWSTWMFSHDSFCYFSAKGVSPRATNKGRGPRRFAEGGEGLKEPSCMEGEPGDLKNVAALPNSMLACLHSPKRATATS